MTPVVTIAVPVYQGVPYLADALESAVQQTYPELEILVCDDGSTDGSMDLARRLLQESGREFRIVTGPRLGMVENWNRCLTLARGRYVKFLFHDDWLQPECVEQLLSVCGDQVAFSFAPRACFLQSDPRHDPVVWETWNAVESSRRQAWKPDRPVSDSKLLLGDPALLDGPLNKIGEPTSVLLNLRFLEEAGCFDKKMGQFADLEMWYRWMRYGAVGYVDRELSTFRIHSRQQTSLIQRDGEVRCQLVQLYRKLQPMPLSGRSQALIARRLRVLIWGSRFPLLGTVGAEIQRIYRLLRWTLWRYVLSR